MREEEREKRRRERRVERRGESKRERREEKEVSREEEEKFQATKPPVLSFHFAPLKKKSDKPSTELLNNLRSKIARQILII